MYFYAKEMKEILQKYKDEDRVTFCDCETGLVANVVSATQNGQDLQLTTVTDDVKSAITVKELKLVLNGYNMTVNVTINGQDYDEIVFYRCGSFMQLRGAELHGGKWFKNMWNMWNIESKECPVAPKKPLVRVTYEDICGLYKQVADSVLMAANNSEEVSPVVTVEELQLTLKNHQKPNPDPGNYIYGILYPENGVSHQIQSVPENLGKDMCLEMDLADWNDIWHRLRNSFIILHLALEARKIIRNTVTGDTIRHSQIYHDLINTIEQYEDKFIDAYTFAERLLKNAEMFTKIHCYCNLTSELSPIVKTYTEITFYS